MIGFAEGLQLLMLTLLLFQETFERRQRQFHRRGKPAGHCPGQLVLQAVIGERPVAAGKFDPDVVLAFLPTPNLQQADFAGLADMGATAGAAVAVRDRYEADLLEFRAGRFTQRVGGQFGGLDEFRLDRPIGEDHGIGGVLNVPGLLGRQSRQRHVDLDGGGAEMEADIFRLVLGEKDAGQDVFAGVLLHVVEPPLPVDFADDRAVAGIAVDSVDDLAVLGLDG